MPTAPAIKLRVELEPERARQIFALCWELYDALRDNPGHTTRHVHGCHDYFQTVDYVADLVIIARRKLTLDQFRVFERRYLWGWSIRACYWSLAMEHCKLQHLLETITERLGREFDRAGLQPVDYFADPRAARLAA